MKIDETTEFHIEKVLKQRTRQNQKEVLVRWMHWLMKYNSWIPEINVKYLVDKEELLPALREAVKFLSVNEIGTFLFPSYLCYGYQGDDEKVEINHAYNFGIDKSLNKFNCSVLIFKFLRNNYHYNIII